MAWSTPAQANLGRPDRQSIEPLFNSRHDQSGTWPWENTAYVGNYDGFRVFDIADPAHPLLLSDVDCFNPQNDVSVWGGILVLSVDQTPTGPECGAGPTPDPADPTGWESLRLFDVSDPCPTCARRTSRRAQTELGVETRLPVPPIGVGLPRRV